MRRTVPRTRRGRRYFSIVNMMTLGYMKSLDLIGDQEVVTNPGYMGIVCLKIGNSMSETVIMEMQSKMDNIITTLNDIKESTVERVYNTKELSEYLKVGVSAIEKMRQDGELAYARLGRTYIYTQSDVDNLIKKNHIEFVS